MKTDAEGNVAGGEQKVEPRLERQKRRGVGSMRQGPEQRRGHRIEDQGDRDADRHQRPAGVFEIAGMTTAA